MPAQPNVCVLRAPGTNCDVETAFAFEAAGANARRMHLFRLLEKPDLLADFQILCIPGGFSYGDDVGAGAVFSQKLQHRLAEALADFLQRDTLILGICNGFQVLLKSGLLPDGADVWPPKKESQRTTTLTWNDNGQYTALWVNLRVHAPNNAFLRGIEQIEMPIAHAEGKFEMDDESLLPLWRERQQVALCYDRITGNEEPADDSSAVLPFPVNPNGSLANIAGLGDSTGRILGLMPHPERFIHATQHPQWTRLRMTGEGDGMKLFRNAVSYFA